MSETVEVDETLAVPVAELRPSLEAVLMVADQPLDAVTLASAVGLPGRGGRGRAGRAGGGVRPSRAAASSCATWPAAGGTTRARSTPRWSRAFVLDGQQARLTQAALETLAVVAYKQPISRARVSAIRGVNVDGVMRTLLTRGPGRGGRPGRRDRRQPLPHDRLLPRADRRHLARRPARAGAVPARHGRHGGRAGRVVGAAGASEPAPEPAPEPTPEPTPEPAPGEHHAPHSGDGTEPDGGTEPRERSRPTTTG